MAQCIKFHAFKKITQEKNGVSKAADLICEPLRTKSLCFHRMFERPTPTLYHLRRIHHWETNNTLITLPPAYLSGKKLLFIITNHNKMCIECVKKV